MLFGADFYEVVYEVGELSWLVFADDDVLLFHDGMTDEVEFEEFACEVGAADLHLLVLFYGECDQVAHRAFEFASRTGEEAVFRYGDFDFHVEVGSDRIGHFAIEFACLAALLRRRVQVSSCCESGVENVPDSGLNDYVDYHWDDIAAEAAKAGVGAEDLLFDDLVRRNRLDRFGPEVLELISDGLYGEEEVDRAFWMGGILDAIEKARRDA